MKGFVIDEGHFIVDGNVFHFAKFFISADVYLRSLVSIYVLPINGKYAPVDDECELPIYVKSDGSSLVSWNWFTAFAGFSTTSISVFSANFSMPRS